MVAVMHDVHSMALGIDHTLKSTLGKRCEPPRVSWQMTFDLYLTPYMRPNANRREQPRVPEHTSRFPRLRQSSRIDSATCLPAVLIVIEID